ncbi:hypothetical protein T265_08804 [Opisthorchis viverrini]|uniref:Uncharacterized protein n=1 Tax=Opisthorchis viverrini TaxID=6198 RepID=A0A075A755_OPIVI|nr:hypothetical protein T265_08804 [Opisthorchis viverrini]KER23269.1 hypothetical protein T265_08804 [Opisthorchis viverrini]
MGVLSKNGALYHAAQSISRQGTKDSRSNAFRFADYMNNICTVDGFYRFYVEVEQEHQVRWQSLVTQVHQKLATQKLPMPAVHEHNLWGKQAVEYRKETLSELVQVPALLCISTKLTVSTTVRVQVHRGKKNEPLMNPGKSKEKCKETCDNWYD